MSAAAEAREAATRLIRVHNMRAFEAWLAGVAAQVRAPGMRWASATVAMPAGDVPREGTVVVLVGIARWALWALGLLHLLAWWRVRAAVGAEQSGYRVRVLVIAR